MVNVDPYTAAGLFLVGICLGAFIIAAVEHYKVRRYRKTIAAARVKILAALAQARHDAQVELDAYLAHTETVVTQTPLYAATAAHIAEHAAESLDDEWQAICDAQGGAA